MATYSKKERIIASVLSATPGLKLFIKDMYIRVNAIAFKKNYRVKLMESPVAINIEDPLQSYHPDKDAFGGYYDIATLNSNGLLLTHVSTNLSSVKLPSADKPVDIVVTNVFTGESEKVAETSAYNWQQGARLHWVTDDLFMFNSFDARSRAYKTKVYSLAAKAVVKEFDYPVQASYKTDYFLSISYRRLLNMRPDYGYRDLPLLSNEEMHDLENDGIWKTDYNTGQTTMLHTLKEVASIAPKDIFDKCTHKVNHLIISPDGKGFMFIHRYYLGKRRFDRLMYSDFKSLRVLIDEEYVSHCFWVDTNTIVGYLKAHGENGYYFLDLKTGEATLCKEMSSLNLGDGHPSVFKDWIVFDSYPDKSRMQRLLVFNYKTKQLCELAELYQSTKYKGETRVDLHPRFSTDGKFISFDGVHENKRRQYITNIESLIAQKK
ncbi:hypothetical protein [Neptunitalea lumnitzerae]|uniref:Glycosyl transferase n=1 Tax=Neptunitalea lumnitzerae TaxID=2965509 RepID=A0ABQ5MH06_9FLAO|nr:hypothetical protein [Neptunitalea sp. Y10]GLB48669.1 hypothetical protein Y10_10370 [Neptunitalea sp. Y10]